MKDTIDKLHDIQDKNLKMFDLMKKKFQEKEQETKQIQERMEKEIEKEKIFGVSKIAKDILEVYDNIYLAVQHSKDKEYQNGLTMIL